PPQRTARDTHPRTVEIHASCSRITREMACCPSSSWSTLASRLEGALSSASLRVCKSFDFCTALAVVSSDIVLPLWRCVRRAQDTVRTQIPPFAFRFHTECAHSLLCIASVLRR